MSPYNFYQRILVKATQQPGNIVAIQDEESDAETILYVKFDNGAEGKFTEEEIMPMPIPGPKKETKA